MNCRQFDGIVNTLEAIDPPDADLLAERSSHRLLNELFRRRKIRQLRDKRSFFLVINVRISKPNDL